MPVPDVPALFEFSIVLRREDAHPSRRFFYAFEDRMGCSGRCSAAADPMAFAAWQTFFFLMVQKRRQFTYITHNSERPAYGISRRDHRRLLLP
jgi:hypothetical protein